MFKVEIDLGNEKINKVFQNKLDEDWARYILKNYNVTVDKVEIYWIKDLKKNDFSKPRFELEEKGKLSSGEELVYNHRGNGMAKDSYTALVDKLHLKNKIDKKDYNKVSSRSVNKTDSDMYDLKDMSLFNKRWFFKEKEYELVKLKWPYDSDMNFIGFDFDPEK